MGHMVYAMDPFILEAVEPALCRRVVPGFALSPDGSQNGASLVFPAVPFPGHRADRAVGLEFVLQDMTGVLASGRGAVGAKLLASRFFAIGRPCFESVMTWWRRCWRAVMPLSRISRSTRSLLAEKPRARGSRTLRGLS